MPEVYRDDDNDALYSMIHRAVGRGDVEMVRALLDKNPSLIHDRDCLKNEPLHAACWAKHLPVVSLLLERGADVNARGDFGETPLHYAIRDDGADSNAIVSLLLQSGADIEAKDERLQQNALGWALREFNNDLSPSIQMLRDKGSSIGLEGAMILGDVERVRYLLSEAEEQLSVRMVQPVLHLSKSCGQIEIGQMIDDWLKQKSRNG